MTFKLSLIFCLMGLVFRLPSLHAERPSTQIFPIALVEATGLLESRDPSTDEQIRNSFRIELIKAKEDSPGLINIGSSNIEELVSARRVARAIRELYGYTLVLMGEWQGMSVPGFDGLIVDRNYQVVSNFSLKTISSSREKHFRVQMALGIDGLVEFSKPERWSEFLFSYVTGKASRLGSHNETIFVNDVEKVFRFQMTLDTVTELTAILGIPSDRPNWLLMDIDESSGLKNFETYSAARYTYRRGVNPQKILVLRQGSLTSIQSGKIELEAKPSCEQLLLP